MEKTTIEVPYNRCSDSTSDVAMMKVNLKEIRKNLKKEEKMKKRNMCEV